MSATACSTGVVYHHMLQAVTWMPSSSVSSKLVLTLC